MYPLSLLPLSLFFHVTSALLNVSIDDTSSLVTYTGDWQRFSSGLDFGGSHSISSDTSGSATFTFTGVAIYYLAPRWPYAVNTELTLDGGQGVIVNLTDPNASPTPPGGSESAESSVAWSATGLSNASHSLVLTMALMGEFVIADGFIYTVNNGSSSAPSSSSTFSSSVSSSFSSSVSSSATLAASSAGTSIVSTKTNTLAIGLGVALGAAALIAAGIIASFVLRRRARKQRPRTPNILDEWGPDVDPPAPVPFIAPAAHAPTMSDASTGPLLATSWERDRPESEYHDDPRSTMRSLGGSISQYGGSVAQYGGSMSAAYLPPGARAAEPEPYGGEMGELASGSGSITRTASSAGFLSSASSSIAGPSSARREKARPLRAETYTPAPPAYSES